MTGFVPRLTISAQKPSPPFALEGKHRLRAFQVGRPSSNIYGLPWLYLSPLLVVEPEQPLHIEVPPPNQLGARESESLIRYRP
ncbi:hypothetical protein FBZ94_11456 [Bradyrhizobium sacchari]|uniref:Uncharacterized protein n=1 Tax=Bradyrhizobium sacchari TaxID=1399419 RepID=A0A560JF24_9BRAD|nr:hypothetical protein FBZ94_11456 [Bradyrhizobium sacchari]TWB67934.1 hypothetical protein FBZ95_11356 [Bradyrhizobium sacchari]